jgi:RNA polymerase sigma factor (sigma-70 family)
MMITKAMSIAIPTDADLVGETLSGNRDAFGRIVTRYQSLICSLAYSATGSLGQSEDLAQETFITAWKHLGHLRERDKLRAWLCGIARNRINGFLRREGREPVRDAEPLEEVSENHSLEPLPPDYVMSREEEAILWRSLERIPEIYREPLVLFYREHQSVERVAEALELSEDAVHQRLSRGRKMLQEQVLAFVEGALERTNPGKAFTLGVLGALPAVTFSAKAASVGAAVKGGAGGVKTAGAAGLLGVLLGPLVVFVPNYIAYRVSLAGAQSEEERRGVKTLFGRLGLITLGLFIPVAAVILWLTRNQPDRSYLSGLFATILVLIFLPTIWILALTSARKGREYYRRVLTEEYAGVFPKPAWEFCSESKFLGLPLVHICIGDRFAILKTPVKAWIAIGSKAIGGLFAFGGLAIAPVSFGGFSIGLLSFGGLALGGVALGGIAAGVWPLFGGLIIGWQAFDGCFAIAWNAAVGAFALAHDFALGRFALAAQANNEIARQFIYPNALFRCAEFINRHWLWLNLFWIVPFFVLWRVNTRTRKQKSNPLTGSGCLIALALAATLFGTGCNKSGKLGQPSAFTLPAGPVELKLKWPASERTVKSINLKIDSEISMPNPSAPIKQMTSMGQKYGLTVLNADADGGHEVEMEVLGASMKLNQGGKTVIDYDSEKKASDTGKNPVAAAIRKMFENIIGAKFQFFLDASNHVERTEGVDALMARLETGGPPMATAGIKSMFNEGYLKQMIGSSEYLPSKPVQMNLAMGELGTLMLDYNFTFQNWETHGKRVCARLEYDGTLKGHPNPDAKPAAMTTTIQDGTCSGVSWFDPELGVGIDGNVSQDLIVIMTMPINVRGKTITQTLTNVMHQVITIKLDSVK